MDDLVWGKTERLEWGKLLERNQGGMRAQAGRRKTGEGLSRAGRHVKSCGKWLTSGQRPRDRDTSQCRRGRGKQGVAREVPAAGRWAAEKRVHSLLSQACHFPTPPSWVPELYPGPCPWWICTVAGLGPTCPFLCCSPSFLFFFPFLSFFAEIRSYRVDRADLKLGV